MKRNDNDKYFCKENKKEKVRDIDRVRERSSERDKVALVEVNRRQEE